MGEKTGVAMLGRRFATVIGVVAIIGTALLSGGSALAQGYPPGTAVPLCIAGDVSAGNVSVGQKITFVLCGNFAAGSTVTISVNGAVVLPKAPTNGKVKVIVTVLSKTVVSVDDPVNAAAVCGTNTVNASGLSAGGGTSSVTGTFNLICAPTTTTRGGGLAFTGANVMRALVIAFVLIVLGALLVVFQRRRRQAA